MPFDTSCLDSTVKNTCGQRRVFSFLGPHGRELAANEQYTFFGSIQDHVGARAWSGRTGAALKRSLAAGDLEILHGPGVFLESPDGTTKQLALRDGGALTAVDPCWTSSV